jgi:cell division protease FtsH
MAERLLREEVLGVEALVALLGPPPHGEYAWLKEGDGTSRNSTSAEGASPSSQG